MGFPRLCTRNQSFSVGLFLFNAQALPEEHGKSDYFQSRRVGLHIVLFEACSTFTRVAACTLALSPIRDTLIEGFSHFVTSMTAPMLPAGAIAGWNFPPSQSAASARCP